MVAKKKYTVQAKVWLYPGMAAWHFVNVDKKQSEQIKEMYGKRVRGFGSIRVSVTLGKSRWDTSIFPDKQSGTYLLPIKAKIRAAEQIDNGDTVTFKLDIRV